MDKRSLDIFERRREATSEAKLHYRSRMVVIVPVTLRWVYRRTRLFCQVFPWSCSDFAKERLPGQLPDSMSGSFR